MEKLSSDHVVVKQEKFDSEVSSTFENEEKNLKVKQEPEADFILILPSTYQEEPKKTIKSEWIVPKNNKKKKCNV